MLAIVLQLKGTIQRILNLNYPNGKAPPLRQHFITRQLAANLDYRRVKQKLKELNQVATNSIEVYKAYFNKFKAVVYKYSIIQGDIYNIDKTGFKIGVGGSQWIITINHQKAYLSPLELNRDYIILVETISANSEVLPPLLII